VFPISNARWLAYAVAGTATAVGSAPSAEAEIHYSGLVNIRMEHINSVFLPLTNGASLNFTIFYSSYPNAYFRIVGAEKASALARSSVSFIRILQRIGEGHSIRSCDNSVFCPGKFGSVAGKPGIGAITRPESQGSFRDPRSGIIGFKFNVGNGTQYGWARIVGPPAFKYRYEIKDYAWADSGERIVAGQRSSTDRDVSLLSEFGSLGLLATGANGLDLWRQIRAEKVQ